MQRSADFQKSVIIALDAAAPSGDVSNGLAKGVAAIVDETLTVVSYAGLAAGANYRIVQGQGVGKPLVQSPVLVKGDENTTITYMKFAPTKEQVSYIGYDPVAGSGNLPTSAAINTNYHFGIIFNGNTVADRSQGRRFWPQVSMTAGASAFEYTLANKLAIAVNAQMANQPEERKVIGAEVVNSAVGVGVGVSGGAAAYEFGTSVTVAYGSNQVICQASCLPAGSSTTGLAVGDFLRFGRDNAATLPSVAYGVYRVTAISGDGLTITLDRPYMGYDQVLSPNNTLGNSEVGVIASATALAGSFGLKLVGQDNLFHPDEFPSVSPNSFIIQTPESGNLYSTAVSTPQKAYSGVGTFKQVANEEHFGRGFEGEPTLGIPAWKRSTVLDPSEKFAVSKMHPDVDTYNRRAFSCIFIHQETKPVKGIGGSGTYKNDVLIYLEISDGTVGTKNDVSPNGEQFLGLVGLTNQLDADVYA